jgi:hypothetical protein
VSGEDSVDSPCELHRVANVAIRRILERKECRTGQFPSSLSLELEVQSIEAGAIQVPGIDDQEHDDVQHIPPSRSHNSESASFRIPLVTKPHHRTTRQMRQCSEIYGSCRQVPLGVRSAPGSVNSPLWLPDMFSAGTADANRSFGAAVTSLSWYNLGDQMWDSDGNAVSTSEPEFVMGNEAGTTSSLARTISLNLTSRPFARRKCLRVSWLSFGTGSRFASSSFEQH